MVKAWLNPQSTKVVSIHEALTLLRPYDLPAEEKTRLGRSGDGGYVLGRRPLPRLLYSFGVAQETSFEYELAEGGCRGYLFDHTVDGMPQPHPNLSFSKEGIGEASPGSPLSPLLDFVRRYGHEDRTDMLLKLDVEGAEYDVIGATPEPLLACFEQIALEVHDLRLIGDDGFRARAVRMFERLNRQFTLCHVHANNCAPLTFVEGFAVADVLELTYVRSDLVQRVASQTIFPTSLDCANDPDRQDFGLFFYPFFPLSDEQATAYRATVEASVSALEYDASLRSTPGLSEHDRKMTVLGRKPGPLPLRAASSPAPGVAPIAAPGLAPANRPKTAGLLRPAERTLSILYFACHETLEYDDIRMLTDMGHRVFSVGGLANKDAPKPSTRPVKDQFYWPDRWAEFAADPANDLLTKRVSRSFAQQFDLAIVNHEAALLDLNAEALAGLPIVFRSIGQSNNHHEHILARHADAVQIVRYSEREVGLPNFCRTDRVIYFGKYLGDFPKWEGGSGRAITFHNSYPTRGDVSVPRLVEYDALSRTGPFDLYGFWNESMEAWRGLAPADLQLELFRTAGVYLYAYSVPPSYTLSLVEAMLVGAPVVAPSTAAVLAELGQVAVANEFSDTRYEVPELLNYDPALLWDTPDQVLGKVRDLLDSPAQSREVSQRLRYKASMLFDVAKIASQWQQFMMEIVG